LTHFLGLTEGLEFVGFEEWDKKTGEMFLMSHSTTDESELLKIN
jgi:hypothetical protein